MWYHETYIPPTPHFLTKGENLRICTDILTKRAVFLRQSHQHYRGSRFYMLVGVLGVAYVITVRVYI